MENTIPDLINELNRISNDICNLRIDEDKGLGDIYGQDLPPVSKSNIANMIFKIINQLEIIEKSDYDIFTLQSLNSTLQNIKSFKIGRNHSTINTKQFILNTITLLVYLNLELQPYFRFREISNNELLPQSIHNKLNNLKNEVEDLIEDKDKFIENIERVNNLDIQLQNLPNDFEELKNAKQRVIDLQIESFSLKSQIDEFQINSKIIYDEMLLNKVSTDKIVEKCDEAYRISTTTGLASAFDSKSKNLNTSMIYWIIGLTISLILGGYIGSIRISAINDLLKENKINNYLIVFNVLLSIISVGGPIWFAWLATKQINQRFKLAEDYGFKASVAKAYEGYRKEAFRLDVKLEERLFSSALSRLEEAPLRLLESKDHSSPWHELINNNKFFNKELNKNSVKKESN